MIDYFEGIMKDQRLQDNNEDEGLKDRSFTSVNNVQNKSKLKSQSSIHLPF